MFFQLSSLTAPRRAANSLHVRTLICLLAALILSTAPSYALLPSGEIPTATLSLTPTAATGSSLQVQDLFSGQPGFEGNWSSAQLSENGQSLTYTLQGRNGEPLPPHTDLSVIHLYDPSGDPDRSFLVTTDGGGTIIILDDY